MTYTIKYENHSKEVFVVKIQAYAKQHALDQISFKDIYFIKLAT